MECLFCRIVAREVPADIVVETEDSLVCRDINPQAPVHVLAIPRRHVVSAAHLTDADGPLIADLFAALRAAAASEGVSSYRIVTNVGPDAGQSVMHLHFHMLADRQLGWPPG